MLLRITTENQQRVNNVPERANSTVWILLEIIASNTIFMQSALMFLSTIDPIVNRFLNSHLKKLFLF